VAERLLRISTSAFRGVPDRLDIVLPNGRSMIVLGENGTGKSTIVDALEWFFTGRIAYLSHEGRAEALRNLAASADVETSVEIATNGGLGGRAVIPDGPPAAPRQVGQRETFLLRGRTLAEFIDRTKGEKWRVLAEILGLDAVDRVRLELQRARNDLRREARDVIGELTGRADAIAATLKVAPKDLSTEAILRAVSERCREGDLDPPASFEALLDPTWAPVAPEDTGISRAAQMSSLASELKVGGPTPDAAMADPWNERLKNEARPDTALMHFLRSAEELLQRRESLDECPLCHQPIAADRLQELVRQALDGFQEAARKFETVQDQARGLIDAVTRADGWRRDRRERALTLKVSLPPPPLSPVRQLRDSLDRHVPLDRQVVEVVARALREWDTASAATVSEAVPSAPTPKDRRLWEIAALAQQAREWRCADVEARRAEKALELADTVFGEYQERQGKYVQEVLKRISGRVAEIYGDLHPGEGLGAVDVELWGEKGVELSVDFHGRRAKPPHGVLSESHLNSLAIALFLGMAETFNDMIGFLVLDDVVNSFDIGHRGQLAEVLTNRFEDRQLVVLTHDPIFFERVARLAPSWIRYEFTSWSFDEGPRTTAYESRAVLAKARTALNSHDTMGAGQKGRRALEELLQETCEGLAAPIPFRRGATNDRRDLGELFKGLRRGLKEYAPALLKRLEPLLRNLEADTAAALNVEAHASLGQAASTEIKAALLRIEELDAVWSCGDCGTRIWTKGTPEAARCRCGRSHFPPPPADGGVAPDGRDKGR
jgi:hypothetical protein